jgi:2-polyprenyl-3-methyl-5-hydroxy-6-metoxy-1,4-benzoquinol methylase
MIPAETSSVVCDLCGALPREPLINKHGLTYSRCGDCGLVYASTRLAAIEEYNESGTGQRQESYASKLFGARAQSEYRRTLRRLERYRQTGRLLDLGCNVGGFLLAAREAGWTPTGIEPSAPVARYGREHHGLEVIANTIERVNLPGGAFDVVYSNAVLEHLPSPRSVLSEVWRVLRPGGVMTASTVNFASYTGQWLGGDWHLVDPRAHLTLFSPETLRRYFEQAKFEVLSIGTRGVRFTPRGAVRLRGLRRLIEELHKLPYSLAARWTGKGDHVTVLARKPGTSGS